MHYGRQCVRTALLLSPTRFVEKGLPDVETCAEAVRHSLAVSPGRLRREEYRLSLKGDWEGRWGHCPTPQQDCYADSYDDSNASANDQSSARAHGNARTPSDAASDAGCDRERHRRPPIRLFVVLGSAGQVEILVGRLVLDGDDDHDRYRGWDTDGRGKECGRDHQQRAARRG